jgi:hypothetical protein
MEYTFGAQLPTKLKWPSRLCVYGPPNSGKSHLILEILSKRRETFERPVDQVIYLYGEEQPVYQLYRDLPGVTFTSNYKEVDDWIDNDINQLIIVDDFVLDLERNQEFAGWVTDLYVKRARHSNTSIIFATQNLFAKNLRILRLSCSNLILFSSKTDSKTISVLASQIAPQNSSFVLNCYRDSVSSERGYLHIDFSSTRNNICYSNFIFPSMNRNKIYVENV